MATLSHRLRVGGRGWRVIAWMCGVACVLAAASWVWSGWHYAWIGRVTNGVLIDEGQVFVLMDRGAEWPDVVDVGVDYGERWRPVFANDGSRSIVGHGGTARWRWWGRTPELRSYDSLMPGLVRVSCPLWGLTLVCGATSGVCAWLARRARLRWAERCARCGYDLRGLGAGAGCPECGAARATGGR